MGRDSLERDSGRPWEFLGALMTPRGPIGREQAGSPAGHSDGALGGCPSHSSGHPHGRPGQDRPPPTAEPAQQHPPSRSPQTTARPRPSRPTCRHSWQPTWQSVVARRTAGSEPVVVHHGSVAPARRELAGRLLARRAPRTGPEALTFCRRGRPKNPETAVSLQRRGDHGCLAGGCCGTG